MIFNSQSILVVANLNTWKEITPLKTNRLQVEKILGAAENDNCQECKYQTDKEEVVISYATSPCQGDLTGWNVPSNTVLRILVKPKAKLKFSELKINEEKLLLIGTESDHTFYIDQERGTIYLVDFWGVLKSINYMPLEADNNLRCKGFSAYNPFGAIVYPNEKLTQNELPSMETFLDRNFINLVNNPGTKIYAVAYSGSDVSAKKYKNLLLRLKKHAYKTRKISPESFEIIDGGKRDLFSVEIFWLNQDAPRPVPSPKEP